MPELMKLRLLMIVLAAAIVLPTVDAEVRAAEKEAEPVAAAEGDWPWWRGPGRNGVAAADQSPPLEWDEEQNVLWQAPIPGRGHGSPTVAGDRVFLAIAEEAREVQSVLCLDRETGRALWTTKVHEGGFEATGRQGNEKSTKASSTVAFDGQRVFINFFNDDAVYTSALSVDGELLWQKKLTDYVMHQGYGSSPAIYGPLVIAAADNKGGGAITAFDRATGEVAWTRERPKLPNYASPIILEVDGRDQLLLTGCDLITSLDPLSGEANWEVEGATTECVTSTVTNGSLMVVSGGYPDKFTSVVQADGSGDVVWKNNIQVYVPCLLIRGEHLYAVTDSGIAICYELESGDIVWRHRLGSNFTSSPVLVGERIYVSSEDGKTFVFRADPEEFELLAENQLGDETFATPAICGSRIYTRVAHREGDRRQEVVYCLGVGR